VSRILKGSGVVLISFVIFVVDILVKHLNNSFLLVFYGRWGD